MLGKQEILSRFEGVRRDGAANKYKCRCPCHADKTASLSVTFKEDRALLYDHAGCATSDILAAAGLQWADICDSKEQPVNNWRERLRFGYRQKFGQDTQITAVYDYVTESGKYLFSKIRVEGSGIDSKKITPFYTVDYENDTYQKGKQTDERCLYREQDVVKAVMNHRQVIIVEGEKDVETLRSAGYTATTAGGVNDWRKEYARFFIGATVIIMPDNDAAGRDLRDRVMKDLRHYAFTVTVVPTSAREKGDVTDYLNDECGGDLKKFKKNLKELIERYSCVEYGNEQGNGMRCAPWAIPVPPSEEPTKSEDGRDLIGSIKFGSEGILSDSVNQSLPYKLTSGGRTDTVFLYGSGVYSEANSDIVKAAVAQYLPGHFITNNRLRNVSELIRTKRRHAIKFEQFDSDRRYINFQNGIYDIEERKLLPHSDKYLTTMQIHAEYIPGAYESPIFKRYISDLCRDEEGVIDKEVLSILQEFGGLILSNIPVYETKKCLVLHSLHGDTGKSQIIKLISALIGNDKVAHIQLQDMNESGSNRFLTGTLIGKRLITLGDQSGADIEDSSLFKQLTGGDLVKAERKGKDAGTYLYRGGILIACNNLPRFCDDRGGHLFNRLIIIPCRHIVPVAERDGQLFEKMIQERSAIVNFFLEGLHNLINNGMQFSESKAAAETLDAYRQRHDTVYLYLKACGYQITHNPRDQVNKSDFDKAYQVYCAGHNLTAVSARNIKQRMQAEGLTIGQGTAGRLKGLICYKGLRKALPNNDFSDAKDEPFEQVETESYIKSRESRVE